MNPNIIAFFVFALGALAFATAMVTRKNPVPAAAFLIAHFFCLAGLYLTLQAQLLAVLQVLVYAGAIMVLVVFVIMLLNIGNEAAETAKATTRNIFGIVLAGVLCIQLLAALVGRPTGYTQLPPFAEALGTVETLGMVLFTNYIFPFEAISLLLLAAIVGAVLLSKRTLE
jgi:NADH-quinone oxidoreductase subunit J